MDRRDNPETADRQSEEQLRKALGVIIQSYKGAPPERLYSEAIHCFDALIDISHNTDAIRDFASRNEIDLKYLVDGANFVISKMHFSPDNHYITLGLPQNASQAEIRERWKRLMLLYHPDRQEGDEAWVSERAKKVNEAYSTLKHESKRMAYDRKLMGQVLNVKPASRPKVRTRAFSPNRTVRSSMNSGWSRTRKYLPKVLVGFYTVCALIFIGFIYLQNRSSHIETALFPKAEQPSETTLIPPHPPSVNNASAPGTEVLPPVSLTPPVSSTPSFSKVNPPPPPLVKLAPSSPPSSKEGQGSHFFVFTKKTGGQGGFKNNKSSNNITAMPDKPNNRTNKIIDNKKQEIALLNITTFEKQPKYQKQKPKAATKKIPVSKKKAEQPQKTFHLTADTADRKDGTDSKTDKSQQKDTVRKSEIVYNTQNTVEQKALKQSEALNNKSLQDIKAVPESTLKTDHITKEEIEDFMQKYIKAYEENDLNTFMAFFSKSVLENNSMNYAAIRNAYKKTFSEKINSYKLRNMEIKIEGLNAFVSGNYNINRYLSAEDRWVRFRGEIFWKFIKENNYLKIISMHYDN